MIIGDPIHFNDILSTEGAQHVSRKHLYDAVSSRIGQRLYDLKAQVDRVYIEQQSMMSHNAKTPSDRAAEIFHRVDWDSFGMRAQFSEESSPSSKPIGQSDDRIVRSPKRRVSPEGGVSLKIKKLMDSTEMMGFAARGLLMNEYKSRVESANVGRPLKAWREYFMNRGL